MLSQVLRTTLRASTKVLTRGLFPSHKVNIAVICISPYTQWNTRISRYGHIPRNARQFCSRNSRNESDESDSDAEDLHSRNASEKVDNEEVSDEEDFDNMYSDHEVFEAFQSELALDDEDEDDKQEREAEVAEGATESQQRSQKVQRKDEDGLRPWNTRERVKACLDKLQKGPDGRYINVLEVATEVDILIASYIKLRKQDDPNRADNSDDDEKYLEGIDIRKFKRLQKRVRDGTYEFQPIVQVPLPKKKIVKLKRKKVKKQHEF